MDTMHLKAKGAAPLCSGTTRLPSTSHRSLRACAPQLTASSPPTRFKCFSSPNSQQAGRRSNRLRSASETVLHEASHEEAAASSSAPSKKVPTASAWEIDFCSRPMLDERGKKVWELLICDQERTFEYSEYFPNSKINSAELKRAIDKILSQPGAVKPDKARFFRGQMQTIISKALTDMGIKPVPSRRCFTIMSWLEERLESVYKQDPRFSDKSQALFTLDLGAPEALPDALRGEKWAFVQLPLANVLDMLKTVESGDMFGATFSLASAGAADLPRNILIPGVAVFSRRALPLAAWTNGLDIATVKADVERSCLVLETGVNQRWRYGGWKPSPDSIEEAKGWEEAKSEVNGLHFLAVQPDPDSEELNGLWLLQDRPPPQF